MDNNTKKQEVGSNSLTEQKIVGGVAWLIGLEVIADHPITCANPSPTFRIYEARIRNDKLYVRGAETMWFHGDLISLKK